VIAHLTGSLLKKTPQVAIIDNGGVGYEVHVPLSTYYALPSEEEAVSLHIYTHVREDALTLFGFHTLLEKEIFLMLTSITGIGPKLANNILSGIGPEELLAAMAAGDALRLQAIPGVGRKTAERIALELKEKAAEMGSERRAPAVQIANDEAQSVFEDALSALLNLGYSPRLAKGAVRRALGAAGEGRLEGVIREALKSLT
jgi:Holliday junction DNA helicase RuvA